MTTEFELQDPIYPRRRRTITSHICIGLVGALCGSGAALNWADGKVRDWQQTFSQAAVYAGCGHMDQVGGFAFNAFPQAIDDASGEPYPMPVKKPLKTARKGR